MEGDPTAPEDLCGLHKGDGEPAAVNFEVEENDRGGEEGLEMEGQVAKNGGKLGREKKKRGRPRRNAVSADGEKQVAKNGSRENRKKRGRPRRKAVAEEAISLGGENEVKGKETESFFLYAEKEQGNDVDDGNGNCALGGQVNNGLFPEVECGRKVTFAESLPVEAGESLKTEHDGGLVQESKDYEKSGKEVVVRKKRGRKSKAEKEALEKELSVDGMKEKAEPETELCAVDNGKRTMEGEVKVGQGDRFKVEGKVADTRKRGRKKAQNVVNEEVLAQDADHATAVDLGLYPNGHDSEGIAVEKMFGNVSSKDTEVKTVTEDYGFDGDDEG